MAFMFGASYNRSAATLCSAAICMVAQGYQVHASVAESIARVAIDAPGASPLLPIGTIADSFSTSTQALRSTDEHRQDQQGAAADRMALAAQVERLVIDPLAVAQLDRVNDAPGLRLPVGPGRSVLVNLSRIDAIAPDAELILMSADGPRPLQRPTMQFWSGTVDGDAESWVFLGLAPEQVHGWVKTDGKTYLITTADRRDGSGVRETVAYDAAILADAGGGDGGAPPICSGALLTPGEVPPPPTGLDDGVPSLRGPGCKVYNLAIECDVEFRNNFATAADAANYASFMVAASSEIYNRDTICGFRVGFMRVWEGANDSDPWDSANASDQVVQVRSYWISNQSATPRTVAHLLSTRSLGGGSAYVRVVCDTNFGYGANGNLNTSFPYPLADNNSNNWDIMVFSHELGHNFGTGHTHNSCDYMPIVDGCGLSAGGGACESGTQDCSAASNDQGTIMSYCHICSGGLSNINLTFGTRVISRIKTYLNSRPSCGASLAGATLTSTTVAPANSVCAGTNVTFTAAASGPELSYQWFRNNTPVSGATGAVLILSDVQNSQAGSYHVVARNPCSVLTSSGSPISLSVSASPSISAQPVSATVLPTSPVTFQVTATGSGLTYRWRRNGVNLTNQTLPSGTVIAGATTRTLSLTNVQTSEQGSYDVVVTNSTSCTRTSAVATLTVSGTAPCPLDISGNRVVDADDVFAFLGEWFGGTGGPGPGGACVLPGPVQGCAGDWNNSGFVTADDVFAYLSGWFAFGPGTPCP